MWIPLGGILVSLLGIGCGLVSAGFASTTIVLPPLIVTFTSTTVSDWLVLMKKESSLADGKSGGFSIKPTKNSFPSFVYMVVVVGRGTVG